MFEPTLLQYENLQEITKQSKLKNIEENMAKAEKMALMSFDELVAASDSSGLDLLDILIPPRIAEKDGQFWYQQVSRTPACTTDLNHLEERLNGELVRQEAREIGLCDVRRNLYDQLFDEMTRQEIVTCPERGRLLRLVRREVELSIEAVLACYESGLAYGIKKKLTCLMEKRKLEEGVTRLLSRIAELNDLVVALEPQAAEVREVYKIKEVEVEEAFAEEEAELELENKDLLVKLVECINVTIEEEKEEEEVKEEELVVDAM